MSTEVKEKKGWLANIVVKSKASDEDKFEAFQKFALKVYTKNVARIQEEIKRLEEAIVEIKEKATEVAEELREDIIAASYSLDGKEIGTREQRERVFGTFDLKLSETMQKSQNHQETTEDTIKEYEEIIKVKKESIAKLKEKITLLK